MIASFLIYRDPRMNAFSVDIDHVVDDTNSSFFDVIP